MAIKDFFNRSSQVVVSSSLKKLSEDAESPGYINEYIKKENRVEPHVDFSKPENFAKYGSALEYYEKSLEYIYGEYPYDGSLKEKVEWRNNASLLDLYLYDNRYPKTTGYAIISSDGWGTPPGSRVSGYGAPASTDYEYINIKGGPNSVYGSALGTSSLSEVFDSKSNIFDQSVTGTTGPVSATRESNLQADLAQGVTVELWLKTGSLNETLTEKQVVFDLWNGEASSSAGYGRLRIELTGSGNPFLVTVMSGTDGYFQQSIGSGLDQTTLSDWGHFAFSFANSGSTIETRLYKNGDLNDTLTTPGDIGELRGGIEANIGALTAAPSGNVYASVGEGWGKLSGSIDEFRFWKTRRTEKEISRNYFTSDLGGGTNTDTANLNLGVYYKFNEGIVGVSSIDSVVLDYSGRISNGTWQGYPSSNARNTGSAITSASVGTEELDPVMRSTHPTISALQGELNASGSLWDYENNSSLYYTMPTWIIEEDEGNGTTGDLKKLTQIMASYLDNLDILIGELPKFNIASYPSSSMDSDGKPSKLYKPYPYVQTAVRSFGMDAPELFSNSTVLEYYRNRDETKEYEEDLNTVKGIIYNNIYNNLVDIYKAKGTEKSFRNLIRCFGLGDDVIRINAYANNDTYKFETKRRADNVTTKAVNLNHIDRFAGTVYQFADSTNPDSVSYISGSSTAGLSLEDSFPITLEAEVVFPKKIPTSHENASSQEYTNITSSLFGMHTARATSPTETDLTWATTDSANFQVYAVRDQKLSKDVKFVLTSLSPSPIPELTSSFFQNTYDNQKWNFAVRLKPTGYPQSFTSGSGANDYVVEFYGVSYIADRMIHQFMVTGSVQKQAAENLLINPKRVYVGSHKTNFTGSTLHYSDVKISSCRYWFDYIDNKTINDHAIDPDNFGHTRPARDSYLLESDLPNADIPEIESLALYWDFQTVTGSDNGSGVATTFDGKFTVQDVTSGSLTDSLRYGWVGKILRLQHTGRGDSFPINSTGSVENLYLYSGKQQLPETVFGDDNIRVLSQEETEVFTKETRPTKTYYAFEKSMYQVISDEIINYFGSIAEFNNLVGEPVNRYRHEYKNLEYLRQFFFERVANEPDLDKFVEYYKWVDATLETMLMQLVPASAQVSDGIDNIVESHVLERNKYRSQFPTLEFNTPDIEGCAITVNKHLYNWKFGHRPLSNLEYDNCYYWKERAERNVPPIDSGDANVDSDRNMILSASVQTLERLWCTPHHFAVEKKKVIHGGINYSENKKVNFYRGINFPHGPVGRLGNPLNTLDAWNADVIGLEDCNDDLKPEVLQKTKYSFGTRNGRTFDSGTLDGVKGEIAMPFNLLSASQGIGGYNNNVQNKFLTGSQLVNLHSDAYGIDNEIPMQGPFTEKYVGGHQYRHVRLNHFDDSRRPGLATPNSIDGQYVRGEGWRILMGGGPANSGALGITGPDYGGPYPDPQRPRAWWFREETAKRPVNIRNILQTTSSADTVLSGVLQHGPIGNYEKTYQIVQTSGRSTNNFWFNENSDTVLLPERYATNNPTTTNVHTLVAVRPTTGARARGNTFIPMAGAGVGTPAVVAARKLSNRYDPYQNNTPADRTVFQVPNRTKQDAVIVERFSAPGGPEINSLGFLDIMAAEKSVYNALPYRNLSVRGSGSGEDVKFPAASEPISVSDHLGKRRGLRSLANLHTGRFGSDATYGSITEANYVTSPSFYKVNRNALRRIEGEEGSYYTGSLYDTWHIQHPIPQNDFQYAWISASILQGTTAFGHAPRSGKTISPNDPAPITFLSSSLPDYTYTQDHTIGLGQPDAEIDLGPVDFAGVNTIIYDQTGSVFNILSSSASTRRPYSEPYWYRNMRYRLMRVPGKAINAVTPELETAFNSLMLHRTGPYGFCSWKQIDGRNHSLVRQMRANNTVSIIDPDTLPEMTRNKGYKGYEWGPSGMKTNYTIFGTHHIVTINKDRSVLKYRDPALLQKFKTMDFIFSLPIGGGVMKTKATYANQKKFYVDSKLNTYLKIDEYRDSSADLIMDSIPKYALTPLVNATYTESVYPASTNVYLGHIRQRTSFGNSFWKDKRTDRNIVASPFPPTATGEYPGAQTNSQGAIISSASIWPLDGRLVFTTDPDDVVIATAVDTKLGLGYAGAEGELQNSYNTVAGPRNCSGSSRQLAGGESQNKLQVITGSATYTRRHTLPSASSARSPSSAFGVETSNVTVFSGDAPWDAPHQAGKKPFYNSYGEYVEEMKRVGKDYSIIPEYRMSERVEDYLINGVDKFNDASLFSLTGGLPGTTSSADTDFYKVYSHSDFMKYFGVTQTKMNDLGVPLTELTVTCNALLKLLPYDGFYPASRTVQLATLFSQSYGEHVYLESATPNSTVPMVQKYRALWRPFITPMFAPGILYNTIKSGIAVDFPVLTGGVKTYDAASGEYTNDAFFDHPAMSYGGLTASYVNNFEDEADIRSQKYVGNWLIGNRKFSKRIPFEALVEPENHISDTVFLDMEPHPSCSLNVSASWNGNGDSRYKRAMNNFLAEIPEFFLDNGTFTSFFSKPEEEWTFEKGKTYTMRVQIKKSYSLDFDQASPQFGMPDWDVQNTPQIVSGTETITMYSRPTAFGPPSRGAIYRDRIGSDKRFDANHMRGFGGGSLLGYNAPFTPPYYDGAAWVDLKFVPESNSPTLDDLLAQITGAYLRYSDWASDSEKRLGVGQSNQFGPQQGPFINANSVQISASVNLFGKSTGLTQLARYSGYQSSNTSQWVIQTKFETPILNFVNGADGETPILQSANVWASTNQGAECTGGVKTRPYGMWHQYGEIPEGEEGIYLEIKDVPTRVSEKKPHSSTGSLADACGFAKTEQKLGRIANSKTIREAVVAVPFFTSVFDNERQFFEIEKDLIDNALTEVEGAPAASNSMPTSQTVAGESIRQMVDSMQRYVFPPSMDFITYPKKVTPFVMYIFEFEHELSQQDLSDIWQNLPPSIAHSFSSRKEWRGIGGGGDLNSARVKLPGQGVDTKEVQQTKQITHLLDGAAAELLNLDDVANTKPTIRWMIFKVKQKARKSYFSKVVEKNNTTFPFVSTQEIRTFDPATLEPISTSFVRNSPLDASGQDPARNRTLELINGGAGAGGVTEAVDFNTSYNWPYDFFSLVELAKIDQQVKYDTGFEPAEITVQPSAAGPEDSGRTTTSNSTTQIKISGESLSPGPVDTLQSDYITNNVLSSVFEMSDQATTSIVPKIVAWLQEVETHMIDVGPDLVGTSGISRVKHDSSVHFVNSFGTTVKDPTNSKIEYHIKGSYDPSLNPKTSSGLSWNYTISKRLF